jgi:hypothetical protein
VKYVAGRQMIDAGLYPRQVARVPRVHGCRLFLDNGAEVSPQPSGEIVGCGTLSYPPTHIALPCRSKASIQASGSRASRNRCRRWLRARPVCASCQAKVTDIVSAKTATNFDGLDAVNGGTLPGRIRVPAERGRMNDPGNPLSR